VATTTRPCAKKNADERNKNTLKDPWCTVAGCAGKTECRHAKEYVSGESLYALKQHSAV